MLGHPPALSAKRIKRGRREGVLDRGKEKGKKERQEERISGDTRSARVRPKGHHPGDTFGSTLLGSLRVSCSLPHPRDVHFCSLARLQGQRNMGWSARKWRNYIRGREKGGCKSKRHLLLSLSFDVLERWWKERDTNSLSIEEKFREGYRSCGESSWRRVDRSRSLASSIFWQLENRARQVVTFCNLKLFFVSRRHSVIINVY